VGDDKREAMIKINSTDLLDLLGENGERWIKGQWDDAEHMCLHGAIRRCQPVPGDAFIIERVAAAQGWGTDWNDARATTWEMVRDRLAHIEVTDADLADTFGPHWEHIIALVRRAAVLTSGEAEQLLGAQFAASDAAWDATRGAAWDAAWNAARVAARDTTWDSARDAAWDAARAAAWNAARDAARAAAWNAARDAACDAARTLAVRDLIGQHGFTQDHYDLLTGLWRSVIGPVHPDDKEARRG
jgi:hypothetical protein